MSTNHSRFRTAVHALMVIAYVPERQANSDRIAASVATDASVVRRLLSSLRQAGLVRASEGCAGGYALAREPSAITLADVFAAVTADSLFPLPDRLPNKACSVGAHIHRALDGPLDAASDALSQQLSQTSLDDVLARIRQLEPPKSA